MTRAHLRLAAAVTAALATLAASPAFAQTPNVAAKIDAADTAWMLGATGLVLMMTIPGLALFYAGMVRKKNVLATMAQCMAATFLVSILWAVFGYSLTFTGDGAYIGTLDRIFLQRHDAQLDLAVRQDHPRKPVHDLSDDLRRHHGGAGRGLGRGPHALLGIFIVLRILAAAGLCADRALGLGRRLPRQPWRDRFRRRPGGASQCRRRRPGRGLCDRQAARLRQRKSVTA